MISVQIVDDHRVLLKGLERLINESDIARVTGTAVSVQSCRKMLDEKEPEVLLLDINLPDGSGLELCSEIKKAHPNVKILALTSFAEYIVIRRMFSNGASGYILKNAMFEEIMEGIETVARGEQFLCEEVDLIIKKQKSKGIMLTNRERELLRFIVEGYTSTEIADKIFLSSDTVNSYRKNLLLKLGARNTAVLVKMAIEYKLIE